MKRYPFVINRKQPRATVQVTEASNYNVALNKVLELHPGKRVSTKFAKNVERFHNALPSLMETVIDADKIKPFKYKPFKQILNTMDLITARVEAAAQSLKEKKKIYITVDDEMECILSSVAPKNPDDIQAVYVLGSEISLADAVDSIVDDMAEDAKNPKKKSKEVKPKKEIKMKTATKQTSKKKTTAKKSTAKKVVAAKVLKPETDRTIKADSIVAGVKEFIKTGMRKAILKIGSKTIAVKSGMNWSLTKQFIDDGKDGVILVVEGHNGFYHYPTTEHKTVFGNIFKSDTWKTRGSYGQSTFSASHDKYWTGL